VKERASFCVDFVTSKREELHLVLFFVRVLEQASYFQFEAKTKNLSRQAGALTFSIMIRITA
jgi:hypothetical protein